MKQQQQSPEALARIRCAAVGYHAGKASRTLPPLQAHTIGAAGELAFGAAFALPVDFEGKPAGDGGADFTLTMDDGKRLRVDVKTASRPPWGLVVSSDVLSAARADVFVLAGWHPQHPPLLGWLSRVDVPDFGRTGALFVVPRESLHPVGELFAGCRRMRGVRS